MGPIAVELTCATAQAIRSPMRLMHSAAPAILVSFTSLLLTLAAPGATAWAADHGAPSSAASPASHGKQSPPKTAATFAGLRSIGEQIAGAMTRKQFEQIYPILCPTDKARTTVKAFASMLRDLHTASATTTVELVKDDEVVRENRRAGAQTIADLAGLSTVMLPFRLHARGQVGGDSTSLQVWVFRREGDAWCTPLDD